MEKEFSEPTNYSVCSENVSTVGYLGIFDRRVFAKVSSVLNMPGDGPPSLAGVTSPGLRQGRRRGVRTHILWGRWQAVSNNDFSN